MAPGSGSDHIMFEDGLDGHCGNRSPRKVSIPVLRDMFTFRKNFYRSRDQWEAIGKMTRDELGHDPVGLAKQTLRFLATVDKGFELSLIHI